MQIDRRARVIPNQIQQKAYRTSAADTLRSVASMFQVSPSELAKANNLPPDAKLVQGMNLIIPKAKASSGKSEDAQSKDVFTHAPRASVSDRKTATHALTGQAGKGAARTPLGSTSHIIDALDQIIRRAGPATEQARELKVIKDLANALRDLQGIRDGLSNDLRNPDGIDVTRVRGGDAKAVGLPARIPARDGRRFENPLGKYSPDLPGNADKGPTRLVGSPSSNPRDWMTGSDREWYPALPPGSPDGQEYSRNSETGSETWLTRYSDANGDATGFISVTDHADGTRTFITAEYHKDGSAYVQYDHVDKDGNRTDSQQFHFPAKGLNKLLDPSADTPGSGVNPITGLPDGPRHTFMPSQVNPGPEGGTEQPEAPRIQVDRGALVTDPDALRHGPISPAEIEKRFHTPPGPGPRPPDPND